MKKQKLEQLPKFSNLLYPAEISTRAAVRYKNDKNKPYFILNEKLTETQAERDSINPRRAIAHWFVRDFRLSDNHGLRKAYEMAEKHKLPLVTFWVMCKKMNEAHGNSDFKNYYQELSLKQLQGKLANLNVPLVTLEVGDEKDIVPTIESFCQKYDISHLFTNVEYEVDELRLAIGAHDALLNSKIAFIPYHDSCVVRPGELKTKSKGTQFAVFTPWYKAWVDFVNSNYLSNKQFTYPDIKKLETSIELKESAHFGIANIDIPRFKKYWKLVGEDGAREALANYISSDRIKNYHEKRDRLDGDFPSQLSIHISSGTLSPRTVLQELFNRNKLNMKVNGNSGVREWVRQIAWRDFYKHIMCNSPYVCMFKPFQLELSKVHWDYDNDHFQRWCKGSTGFPIVDACMRSLNETGYLNNRGRLIVASFLAKDLLIDWRYGEQYFMSKLVDGDFASNNGGWGFASSTGVDPQPYFRIFNPWTQSEKFDPDGNFIRKWVPELRRLEGKAIHHPYDSESDLEGYPRPIVDHKVRRNSALKRYKDAMTKGKEEVKEATEHMTQ